MTATGTEYEITNELEAGMYSVTVTTTVGESGTFLSGPSSEETTFEVGRLPYMAISERKVYIYSASNFNLTDVWLCFLPSRSADD